jgi:hypothetical protein
MAGTYVQALAARGMAALAFDFTGSAQSIDKVPIRESYVEDPASKTQDIISSIQIFVQSFKCSKRANLRHGCMSVFGIHGPSGGR